MLRTKSLLVLALALTGGIAVGATEAELNAADLKLADDVARMSRYATPPTKYVVANSTAIYSDVRWGSKTTGQLERGQEASVLAVATDWDWLLIGRDGVGIGYIPRGVVAPADQFRAS